jgi:hypothetical protein
MLTERENEEKRLESIPITKKIIIDKTKPKEIVVILKQKPSEVKEESNEKEGETQKQREGKIRKDFWNYAQGLVKEKNSKKEIILTPTHQR